MKTIQESFFHYNYAHHFNADFKCPGSGMFVEEIEKDQFNLHWLNLAMSRLSWERRTVEKLFLDSKNVTHAPTTHTIIMKSDEEIGNKRINAQKPSTSLAAEKCLKIIPKGGWRQGMVVSRCAVPLPLVKTIRCQSRRDDSDEVCGDVTNDVSVDISFETYVQMLIDMASCNDCDVVIPIAARLDLEASDGESSKKTHPSYYQSSKTSLDNVSSPSVRYSDSNKNDCLEAKVEKEWNGVFVISPIPRSSSVAVAEISYISCEDEKINGSEEVFLDQSNGSQINQVGMGHTESAKGTKEAGQSIKSEKIISEATEDDSYIEITVRVISIIDIFKFCLPIDGNDKDTVKNQRISLRKVAHDLLVLKDPRSTSSKSTSKGLNSMKRFPPCF